MTEKDMARQVPIILPGGRSWVGLMIEDGRLWLADMGLETGDQLDVEGTPRRITEIERHVIEMPLSEERPDEKRREPVVLITVA